MKNNFANNLFRYRTALGMSQQDLADKIHTTRQTISVWEKGAGNPTIYSLGDLCDVLKASPTELLCGDYEEMVRMREDSEKKVEEYEDYMDTQTITYKRGFYNIIDEDLERMMPAIYWRNEELVATAMRLHQKGYQVLELFANGFSVFFRTDEEAKKIENDIFEIFDERMHDFDGAFEKECSDFYKLRKEYMYKICNVFYQKVLGKSFNEFAYYWEDSEWNVRGFADSEEECVKQAKEQECTDYTIKKIEEWGAH